MEVSCTKKDCKKSKNYYSFLYSVVHERLQDARTDRTEFSHALDVTSIGDGAEAKYAIILLQRYDTQ